MARPVFVLRVRAKPSVQGGPSVYQRLRSWLKRGLRDFGLQCVSIEEVKTEESEMVDIRKYASGIITAEDVREGPIEAHIVNAYISEKHECLVLELDTGDQFYLWAGKGRALARAYGHESNDWRGHLVRFEHATYTDRKDGATKETVNVTPVSSRDGNAGGPQRIDPANLPKPIEKDLDDSIPF
jgi:hypothetical protein